jgi:hypothetical protein
MIRKRAPIWNLVFVFAFIGAVVLLLGSRYGWSNFLSCYLPIILFVLASVCMGIQDAIDKYGPAWRETENGKSVLTETREVPDVVDGELLDDRLLGAPRPSLPGQVRR